MNLTGEFGENFDFKIEGDFEQSDGISGNRTDFSGTDIWVNWHQFSEAEIKVGQYKAPFGLEHLTSSTKLFTIERSLPTDALPPHRLIGIHLWRNPPPTLWPAQKCLTISTPR